MLHGPIAAGNEKLADLSLREKLAISPVILIIILMGFYPKPVLDLINPTSEKVVVNAGYTDPVAKVVK
jgi:NADH-quinone oxidoreductase subunit M